MKDPFGAVLTIIKNDTAVSAIVSTRVSSEVQTVPCVQLIPSTTSRRPFGPGSGRMSMQFFQAVARCWTADSPTGAIQARQLAGAVSDALHNHPPTTVGSQYIAQAYAPDIEGMTRDPLTNKPFCDVLVNVYAAA